MNNMEDKDNILVSIITVCYNSADTIECTLRSVLQQTYVNYEYIIIDGGSQDDTLTILKKYESLFQEKMKLISEPDDGIYYAMNKGINEAKGQLIGIINSDDYYELDAIQIMVDAYKKTCEKYMVLYGFQRNVWEAKEQSVVLFNHVFLDKQMITHPTCFVTRQVYTDFGTFDTSYKSSADYEFMLRIFHKNKVTFQPVYRIISNFRLGGMSSSQMAYRETLQLQYQYGSISRQRYLILIMRSRFYEFMHRMK